MRGYTISWNLYMICTQYFVCVCVCVYIYIYIYMDETWLYHYDPETKQQSMERWHSCSHRPKKFRVENPLEKFSPRFFGIKTASFSLIIFQRTKLSTRSIIHLCCCNWRKFWRENDTGISPNLFCSCTTMPRVTGHLQPRRTWPNCAYYISITHFFLRIRPHRTSTCSLDWRNNWKVTIFLPTRKSLLSRRPCWTSKHLYYFFLSGLQKLEKRAKKCIVEYVE